MNNINGGGRSRNMMSSVDFYRRVPKDLTEVSLLFYCLVISLYCEVLVFVKGKVTWGRSSWRAKRRGCCLDRSIQCIP